MVRSIPLGSDDSLLSLTVLIFYSKTMRIYQFINYLKTKHLYSKPLVIIKNLNIDRN